MTGMDIGLDFLVARFMLGTLSLFLLDWTLITLS